MQFETARAALLTLDFQREWTDLYASDEMLGRVARVQDAARQAHIPLIHFRTVVGGAYRDGGLPLTHYQSTLLEKGWAKENSPASEIHPRVAPKPGELVITRQHEGPFVGTDLEQVLRRQDTHFLVVAGIPTRASVRNIGTDGPNRFFDTILLSDCCNDEDEQVHRVLLTNVLTHQSQVVTSDEFLGGLSSGK